MWEGIKKFCRDGIKKIHFGRTELQNLGLLQYKAGWGVKAEKVKYFTYDIDRGEFVRRTNYSRGFHNSLFKKMPNSISRAIGAAFYKHIG